MITFLIIAADDKTNDGFINSRRLLELGATPSVKDKDKKWPYNLAKSKECRKVFMRFQADYPDKYDYRKV